MKTVTSKDGTRISYVQLGSGPPLLLVDGAMCSTTFGPMPKLAPKLADRFTVVHYDRRGRGKSGDQATYAVEREVEDVKALIDALGGEAYVYGTSSGAVLAARAVAAGARAKGLVLHEPPLCLDGTRFPEPSDFREQIGRAASEGRRGDAVKMFMRVVGVPAIGIFIMRLLPGVWRSSTAVAHTLPYDFAVLGDTQSGGPLPDELAVVLGKIDVPTMLLVGGKSPPYMHHAAKSVCDRIRGAELRVLPGQMHNVDAKSVAPVLRERFG
jgi:pimeloyl-ACP methyl ester carboxylesterase